MTMTLSRIESEFGVSHLDYLDRDAQVPTVTRIAAQGDVLIRRVDAAEATTPVPATGVPVVRGENGGNTHLLVGNAKFDAADSTDELELVIGLVTVDEGATALLSHPEHGGMLIAPGTYEIRRQREQRDLIEFVQD